MRFKRFGQTAVILFALCAAIQAGPVVNTLDTTGYNFKLNGGGGGASATLNNTQSIEIFCVDFANDIYVPQDNYSAYVTGLTSTNSDMGVTRFGDVTNWTPISNTVTDASVINTATDLGRYQMAAYLVSTYNIAGGNSPANNGIQQAIWDILDPKGGGFAPFGGSTTDTELTAAASWYSSTTTAARDLYLANYRIVSDTTMKYCSGSSGLLCGGFQEQITVVPEPRHLAMLLTGLLLLGSAVYRRLVRASRSNA